MKPSALQRFKTDPRIAKVLRTKPGEEGFSLIELVVVIAVLAILSAVALPNFLGVQKDGQVAAAKNTLATVVKECVVSGLRGTGTNFGSVQSTQGKLNGYTMSALDATCYKASATGDAGLADFAIEYTATDGTSIKYCTVAANDYAAGCFTDPSLTTALTTRTSGAAQTGSW